MPEPFRRRLDGFQYTAWTLYGLHLALEESPRFPRRASIRTSIARSNGASAPRRWRTCSPPIEDVQAGRVPKLMQFGSGPLSLLDPTQAPPGKHTTYAWHVMPLDPDIGGQDTRRIRGGLRRTDPRNLGALLPQHDQDEHDRPATPTPAQDYAREFPNMRNGDIFMGAFNAEQVMYNHFGYRTPIANLYLAGSSGHPGGAISGGAGYITAGIIARDLGPNCGGRRGARGKRSKPCRGRRERAINGQPAPAQNVIFGCLRLHHRPGPHRRRRRNACVT